MATDETKQLRQTIERQKETLRQLQMVKMYRKKVRSLPAALPIQCATSVGSGEPKIRTASWEKVDG